MDLLQTVLNARDGNAVAELGRNFGLDQGQTAAAVGQLVPALAAGLSRNTAQPGGLDSLIAALAGGTHERYLEDPSAVAGIGAVQEGNGILGHILGSKDVSRQVAARASAQSACRSPRSIAEKASSSRMRRGERAKPRASATRWASPPEKVAGRRSARWPTFMRSSIRAARSRRAARGRLRSIP